MADEIVTLKRRVNGVVSKNVAIGTMTLQRQGVAHTTVCFRLILFVPVFSMLVLFVLELFTLDLFMHVFFVHVGFVFVLYILVASWLRGLMIVVSVSATSRSTACMNATLMLDALNSIIRHARALPCLSRSL